ncbi:oxidoreductase [Mycobacterium pseudokansasii]|nr:oxidoreductase [Mycobacterium pseudokansasii]
MPIGDHSIPNQTGRIAIVTGSNTGLGFMVARSLAIRGAITVLAVRNLAKGQQAIDTIRAEYPVASLSLQQLDLTSLASVRPAADQLNSRYPRIDLLINNAGVSLAPKTLTQDGFELHFGTNHLSHFAFTGLLLKNILAAQASRIVTVSSGMHRRASTRFLDHPGYEANYSRVVAYARSKLANLLFTFELQRRLAARNTNTTALAAVPGIAKAEVGRYLPTAVRWGLKPFISPFEQNAAMGALPILRAATDPKATGGQYYSPRSRAHTRGYPEIQIPSGQSQDSGLAADLWAMSENLTGIKFLDLDSETIHVQDQVPPRRQ